MNSKCYELLQVKGYHSMGYLRFDCSSGGGGDDGGGGTVNSGYKNSGYKNII